MWKEGNIKLWIPVICYVKMKREIEVNCSEILVVCWFPREPPPLLPVSFQRGTWQPASNPTWDTILVTFYFRHISYFNFQTLWFVFPPRASGFLSQSYILATKLWRVNRPHSKKIFVIQFNFDLIFFLSLTSPYLSFRILPVVSLSFSFFLSISFISFHLLQYFIIVSFHIFILAFIFLPF